jgi:hypothetical protein
MLILGQSGIQMTSPVISSARLGRPVSKRVIAGPKMVSNSQGKEAPPHLTVLYFTAAKESMLHMNLTLELRRGKNR